MATKKRIIICSDGTWNNPEQKNVTNVVRTARAILPVDGRGTPQLVFYDWGVGSEGVGNKVAGGALGKGIDKNIQDAYRFIVHNYVDGDEIYLFGFSRGAYTARSTAGLIRNIGILKKIHAHLIPRGYKLYRQKSKSDAPRAIEFRRRYSREARIAFVGVWDTVGALGIPSRILRHLNKKQYAFHDTSLSKIIVHACHAVAIDEKRVDFKPTLWERLPREGQKIEQHWFAGVHCDVGGGYAEKGLSDVALRWMWSRAASSGLAFDRRYQRRYVAANPLGKLHRSWKGIYWAKGTHHRPIGELPPQLRGLHPSVRERYLRKRDYRPKKLVAFLKKYPQPGWPA